MRARRPLSLRTRVALASAATAAIVVGAMSALLFLVAPTDARVQAGTLVSSLAITRAEGTAPGDMPPGEVAQGSVEPALPTLPTVDADAVREGKLFIKGAVPAVQAPDVPDSPDFQRTVPVDGKPVMIAISRDAVADSVTTQRTRIVAIGVGATALAALLGWYFASGAVAPLRRLTAATAGLGDRLELEPSRRSMASETTELAEAMNTMLGRIADERRHTSEALVTARDFAATAAHELRTPLTAMRTDLQVLRSLPLSEADRAGILDDVLASQQTVESTLYALERLTVGDLTTESDWEDVDLGQLVDQVVDDARHAHPAVTIDAEAVEPVRLRGLVAGLRSVLDNAITNAVRHGAADRIEIAVREAAESVVLTVDDNGGGIPEAERAKVFERFHRASSAPGSGLGLALVAQQARLHGGDAEIGESPLGGVRLTVTMSPRTARND
ncbi:sensor histidine kinase [Nocardia crassostreae]|uniref:sensor histidine kinase n=1 Tax=Nocardia crassostreae TaxID=53428 RepID=UPI0008324F60|nr:HAMP domain-containing sensor histidine kinase [Nocardia crassostreae]